MFKPRTGLFCDVATASTHSSLAYSKEERKNREEFLLL